jgi:hypothetical protein
MNDMTFRLHGAAEPRVPLVLDSPHSCFQFPAYRTNIVWLIGKYYFD